MGKMLAADAAWKAAEACLQTFGGFGYAREYGIERKWRETRLYQTAPISTNMILAYVAQHVLGHAAVVLTGRFHPAKRVSPIPTPDADGVSAENRCLRLRPRLLERRHRLGEFVEPGDQLGMAGAPFAVVAEVEVAQRASQRQWP